MDPEAPTWGHLRHPEGEDLRQALAREAQTLALALRRRLLEVDADGAAALTILLLVVGDALAYIESQTGHDFTEAFCTNMRLRAAARHPRGPTA